MTGAPGALLELRGLRKGFTRGGGLTVSGEARMQALRGVDLDVAPGSIQAVVGSSGAGKTTLALCALRLLRPDAGSIRFAGRDITELSENQLRPLRPRFQPVFQDPWGALTAHRRVRSLLVEPLRVHRIASGEEAEERAALALAEVGLGRDLLAACPPGLSGGERQRVALARALILEPRLLVCDEPTSALDLSEQARILALLARLRATRGLACLLVSHDLAVVRHLADRVAVMEAGRIVEEGPTSEIFEMPRHAETRVLLEAGRPPKREGRG